MHTGLRRCTQGVERAHLSAEASGPVRCMVEGAILNGTPKQLFLKKSSALFRVSELKNREEVAPSAWTSYENIYIYIYIYIHRPPSHHLKYARVLIGAYSYFQILIDVYRYQYVHVRARRRVQRASARAYLVTLNDTPDSFPFIARTGKKELSA